MDHARYPDGHLCRPGGAASGRGAPPAGAVQHSFHFPSRERTVNAAPSDKYGIVPWTSYKWPVQQSPRFTSEWRTLLGCMITSTSRIGPKYFCSVSASVLATSNCVLRPRGRTPRNMFWTGGRDSPRALGTQYTGCSWWSLQRRARHQL